MINSVITMRAVDIQNVVFFIDNVDMLVTLHFLTIASVSELFLHQTMPREEIKPSSQTHWRIQGGFLVARKPPRP